MHGAVRRRRSDGRSTAEHSSTAVLLSAWTTQHQQCRLQNDLYCVEWDVKLYYTLPYHNINNVVSKTTYTVSSGTLNSTIPYRTITSTNQWNIYSTKQPSTLSLFYRPFSRRIWIIRYQNVSIPDFIGSKGDGSGGNNWSYKTCKAPVKKSPPKTNTQFFYRLDDLPVTIPFSVG